MFEQIGLLIQGVMDIWHKYPVQIWAVWVVVQWEFGVIVDSLVEPMLTDTTRYKILYRNLHRLAGNRSETKKNFDPPATTGLPNFPTTR